MSNCSCNQQLTCKYVMGTDAIRVCISICSVQTCNIPGMKGNFLGRKGRTMPFWIFQSMGLMLAASSLSSTSPFFGDGTGTSTCWNRGEAAEHQWKLIKRVHRNFCPAGVRMQVLGHAREHKCDLCLAYLEAFCPSAILVVLKGFHRLLRSSHGSVFCVLGEAERWLAHWHWYGRSSLRCCGQEWVGCLYVSLHGC